MTCAVFARSTGIEIPLVLDESGDRFRLFDVAEVPTALLTDERGRIVGFVPCHGFRPGDRSGETHEEGRTCSERPGIRWS
jgi:hypothetical protein